MSSLPYQLARIVDEDPRRGDYPSGSRERAEFESKLGRVVEAWMRSADGFESMYCMLDEHVARRRAEGAPYPLPVAAYLASSAETVEEIDEGLVTACVVDTRSDSVVERIASEQTGGQSWAVRDGFRRLPCPVREHFVHVVLESRPEAEAVPAC